ncbi:MAG: glycosyltransferase family 4 protein [Opitutales bacterium]|nr:glycosyltransferase family 4 protein [Opitutales bacterium]
MHIVLFTHPSFLGSLSMPRFAEMIRAGMTERAHSVEVWSPRARFFRSDAPRPLRKWLGYLDQFLLFPLEVRRRLRTIPPDTLFVFADQALGPWIPMVSGRPHVIHCHDFLAQWSALNEIPENPTRWSGRQYQKYIRRGFQRGKHFVSISEATRSDLHKLLGRVPPVSEVVYNGLNGDFHPVDHEAALAEQPADWREFLREGCLLHVGGAQWYKNRAGLVEAYAAYIDARRYRAESAGGVLPLVLVGDPVEPTLQQRILRLPKEGKVLAANGISFPRLRALYSLGEVFLFPSLAEGFGWPIAEAMACGCPVLTTATAPMTEVAGGAAELVPVMPAESAKRAGWAKSTGEKIAEILAWSPGKRSAQIAAGLENARRFDPTRALDAYARIYERVQQDSTATR